MLCQMAKLWGKWPHEIAFGANDAPGSDIEMSAIVFDMQSAMAYGEERAAQMKEQSRGRRKRR